MRSPGTPDLRTTRQRRLAALRALLALGFVLALWIPLVQRTTGLLPEWPLGGAENRAKAVRLTPTSWFDGSYAKAYEVCYNQAFGWRSMLVRTANQFRYDLFGKAPRSAGTPVTVGKDGWLYENAYVHDFLGSSKRPSPEAGEVLVARLKRIHAALAARGIGFAVVISPSKPTIYPEYLPTDLKRPTGAILPGPYERVMPRLLAAGLPLIDAQASFLQWKRERTETLFAPTGTHWNFTGAFLVLQEVLNAWRSQLGARVPRPELDGVICGPPQGADADLAQLMNLFRFRGAATRRVPFPRIHPDVSPNARPLRVGIVGDSFGFTLVDALALSRSASDVSFLYYARRLCHYPLDVEAQGHRQEHAKHAGDPFDPSTFDWVAWFQSCDAILLECNAIMLHDEAWGFAEHASKALCP